MEAISRRVSRCGWFDWLSGSYIVIITGATLSINVGNYSAAYIIAGCMLCVASRCGSMKASANSFD
jgi:hypothetical protein